MKKENDRIEDLLVMILLSSLRGVSLTEKALYLNLAGFSNVEIANYLETSAQVIANALSAKRKKGKSKFSKRSKVN